MFQRKMFGRVVNLLLADKIHHGGWQSPSLLPRKNGVFFVYLLRQYFCRGDSFIFIFFVFFKIFIDFVEIMRHLAYSLSNLTLIILSIKIKTLTRNEKEKVICCSFVDFIALYSHATISLRHLVRICVVV